MLEPARVCVIGAGACGLAAAKALKDRKIAFECFEKSDTVGGNWVFKNSNGLSSAYRSLHINTSRLPSQFRDFPMPENYPDYPRHELLAKYLQNYAEAAQLLEKIQFQTSVEQVSFEANGAFKVRLRDARGKLREQGFSAVVVANGHHWDPRFPTPMPNGTFDGIELHAHSYIDPDEPHQLRGKRVCVVGFGNSAVDIACELSHVAEQVFLSVRRGAYVLPKYLWGVPIDSVNGLPRWVPFKLRQRLFGLVYRKLFGSPQSFGLPEPDHRPLGAHPTISSELLTRIGSGDIVPKPRIVTRAGKELQFADGTRETLDAIVYCTGYNITFPFFDPAQVSAPENQLDLYLRVFHPHYRNLFFVGLCQPMGAIFPIAEAQARLIGEYLLGRYPLPNQAEMLRSIGREVSWRRQRYVPSPRHTLQVEYDTYLKLLDRELGRAVAAPSRTSRG